MKLKIAGYLIAGPMSFWLPVVTVELATRQQFGPVIGTIVPPVGLTVAYLLLRSWRRFTTRWLSMWMLVGVYVLGPVMMSLGATVRHGGFYEFNGWQDVKFLLVASLVPLLTLVLAAYHGTMFGLLLGTALMIVIHLRFERRLVVQTRNGPREGPAASLPGA